MHRARSTDEYINLARRAIDEMIDRIACLQHGAV